MRVFIQLILFFLFGLLGAGVIIGAKSEDSPIVDTQPMEQRPTAKPDVFRVSMTKKDCTRIVNHAPDSDVAYQAGVDSHGNTVADVNIPGSQLQFDIPDNISFDLVLNPFDYGGNAKLADVFSNSATNLGTIKYSITSGKITLNGKPLTDQQSSIIAKSCRAQGISK